MSGDLIYTPGVQILIESSQHGIIDVSEDIESGSLTLNENNLHRLSFTLANPRRKYDGVFTPNDRVTVRLKRLTWLQCFAGYLDSVPYFSTYPGSVSLSASCTLKVLKNFPWDPRTQAAFDLLHSLGTDVDSGSQVTVSDVVVKLLNEVARWPLERIHIGAIPEAWRNKFQAIYDKVKGDIDIARDSLGQNPIVAGLPIAGVTAQSGYSSSGPSGGDGLTGAEAWPINDGDMDIILKNIREGEGGRYDWVKPGISASGAYAIQDPTWAKFKGYDRAYQAPGPVQDEKATQMVKFIRETYGNSLVHVPYAWYCPASIKEPNDPKHGLDTKCGGESNWGTVRQYGSDWLTRFQKNYKTVRGIDAPYPMGPSSSASYGMPGTPPAPSTSGAGASGTVKWPIPPGKTGTFGDKGAWGGYRNGYIPYSAMTIITHESFSWNIGRKLWTAAHPTFAIAYLEMCEAAHRDDPEIDLAGGVYRDFASQVALVGHAGVKVPGTSPHGWGTAVDVGVLWNPKLKYGQGVFADMVWETKEYRWLYNNAWKYGFCQNSGLQKGGSKPEAWHWDWPAFFNIANGVINPGPGLNPTAAGGNGVGPNTVIDINSLFPGGLFPAEGQNALFNAINYWLGDPASDVSLESETLYGVRALMNDQSISTTIYDLLQSTGRRFCSGPNGDFLAWWPDLWGEYGMSGEVDVELIELKNFSVGWDDTNLITHQFVEGAFLNYAEGSLAPQGVQNSLQALFTGGIATVDIPNFLSSIVNVAGNDYPWLKDPQALLARFGARVRRSQAPNIYGPEQEFWMAVNLFTEAWGDQFSANAPLTFMPELFPGMRMRIPAYGVQFYVSAVTHRWDLSSDQGFTTDASISAPSAINGSGFYLFPKAVPYAPGSRNPRWGGGGGGGGSKVL